MPRGKFIRRHRIRDVEGMKADLQLAIHMLEAREGEKLEKFLQGQYPALQEQYPAMREISPQHAATLMTVAQRFMDIPMKNGHSGIERLLQSLTITEAKELCSPTLSYQDTLSILEKIEEGTVSHTVSALHALVQEMKNGAPLQKTLHQAHELPLHEVLPSDATLPDAIASIDRTISDLEQLALFVAHQAQQARRVIHNFVKEGKE